MENLERLFQELPERPQPPKARRLIERLEQIEPKSQATSTMTESATNLRIKLRAERDARWERQRVERQQRVRSQQAAPRLEDFTPAVPSQSTAMEELSPEECETLFVLACPSSQDALFYRLQMEEAAQRGLCFVEALRFAAEKKERAVLLGRLNAFRSRRRSST